MRVRPHHSNSELPSDGTAGRVAFREEPDRLVLSNPMLSLAFAATHGAIISLLNRRTQTELVEATQALAEGSLWRLEVATQDGSVATMSSRGCVEFGHMVTSDGEDELRLRLQWRGPRVGVESVDGQVVADVILPAGAPMVGFQLRIELPHHLSARSVAFPSLWSLGTADLLAGESVFVPLSGGATIRDPRAAFSGSDGARSWRLAYPGPASMQVFGYSLGDRVAAWLGSADGSGGRKELVVALAPRSGRLALWMTHYPSRGNDGHWSPGYLSALGLVTGDWFEVAQQYRSWAIHQAWCARGRGGERDLPALTSSYGLWLSHWGEARHAVAAARELQRIVNVPVKLDWRCWHKCACGGAYPDYFPPRDGEEAFARAKAQLADAGVLSQLSFNGLLASPSSEAWQAEQAGCYVVPLPQQAHRQGLVAMCPSTRYWRQKLASLAREAAQRRVEGVYLEDLGTSGPLECRDPDHGHLGLPTAVVWSAGVRALLSEAKTALGRGLHLATDGPVETYLDLVDAFLSCHAAAERYGLLPDRFGAGWSPVPLFASVYHGYSTIVGPCASLVNHRPFDPLAGEEPDQRLPGAVMARDYQGQFCLEVARAAIWGHQLLLSGFAPEQARDESNRRKLAFLSTVLRAQAWGVGALLPFSEFAGPLDIEAVPIELELLINPPQAAPSDRRAVRRSVTPVLGSAWRTPGAGISLVLANIHDQPTDFATRLRSSRLSPNLPIQLLGRTFSEDGDVAAATLGASGSEIGGRIPARSIVLVTLR